MGGRSIAETPDTLLRNQYGVMAIDPRVHPGVNAEAARKFVEWLVSPETQRVIGAFGVKRFGQPLFYPDSDRWKASHAPVR
jgi:tungstate transport system substrate-binding protein